MIPNDWEKTDAIFVNGIDRLTGNYLVEPITIPEFAAMIRNSALSGPSQVTTEPVLGLPPGCNPLDIRQAGWGIVFSSEEDPEIRRALDPLVEHRRKQAGDDLVKVLEYRPGDTRPKWLGRYGVAAGSPDPYKVPYYLLLVGSPRQIPFSFGSVLDVEYAVGRLGLRTPSDYGRYVTGLIAYEERPKPVPNCKEVIFFATEHPYDRATFLSSQRLVQPLAECVPQLTSVLPHSGTGNSFKSRLLCGVEATKLNLTQAFLSADQKQAPIFFVAAHGLGGGPLGDSEQASIQGALLCQDWSGHGKVTSDEYFSADDMPPNAQLDGVIAFLFACYSIGTPQVDRNIYRKNRAVAELAKEPFFSRLPQKMLSHSNGTALACVGHVDRAWGYSIAPADAGVQLAPFQNFLKGLSLGYPVGHAIQDFNHRFATLSTDLTNMLDLVDFGVNVPDGDLASLWLQRNDAEGYAVFGDPAARLRIEDFE